MFGLSAQMCRRALLQEEVQMDRKRIIVAISGASGAIYGVTALRKLRELGIETHLILSKSAMLTLESELDLSMQDVAALAEQLHKVGDVGATIASGSFPTMGMLIAPCSIRTLGEIASGVTQSLISRAADVCLKERRKLVLMVRETPFHLGHLRQMTAVTEMGAIVAPPVPAFYAMPSTLQEMVDHSIGRVLDLFGLDTGIRRWSGLSS